MHQATNRFWKDFDALPNHIQQLSQKNFELLKKDPLHPSLHFKKTGKFWSIRIGNNYRALALKDEDSFIWVWIGSHSAYNHMIR